MLENTFVHIPGIGKITEAALWRKGCSDWSCLLDNLGSYSCGRADKDDVRGHLERSIQCLREGIHQYFHYTLRARDTWRAFPEFRHSCVYLDIETDGGTASGSVTMIGLYDGREYTCLVKGDNLENFRDIISRYSMIVTFFGNGFDLPMLEKRFKGLRFDQIHIDLCPVLRRIGFRGGLKKIEYELGIRRDPSVVGLNGYDAVLLWRKYERLRDDAALEKLVAYNREDVVNLERLAEIAYDGMKAETKRLAELNAFTPEMLEL